MALKAIALALNPELVDNLKNDWCLCKNCHEYFGCAKLAVIPHLARLTFPDNSASTSTVFLPSTLLFSLIIHSTNLQLLVYCSHRVPQRGQWNRYRLLHTRGHRQGEVHRPVGRRPRDHTFDHQCTRSTSPAPLAVPAPCHHFPPHRVETCGWIPYVSGQGGLPDTDGVPAFVNNSCVKWLAEREKTNQPPEVLPARYDSNGTEPHIIRWLKLTPVTPLLTGRALWEGSESESDTEISVQESQKRDHSDNSDTDDERPWKYKVVLSEVGQRMAEKWQLARRRREMEEEFA